MRTFTLQYLSCEGYNSAIFYKLLILLLFLLPFPGEFCLHSKPTLFAAIKRSTFLKRYLKFLVKTVPTECAVVLYLLVVACQFSTWAFKAILCSHFVDIEMKKCLQLFFLHFPFWIRNEQVVKYRPFQFEFCHWLCRCRCCFYYVRRWTPDTTQQLCMCVWL